MKKIDNLSFIASLVLIILNLIVWHKIVLSHSIKNAEIYFLDVGQGDSELLVLPGEVKIITDGGPRGDNLVQEFSRLDLNKKYVDLLIISHPQSDHFGGFVNFLDTVDVGAIVMSGRKGETDDWNDFINKVNNKNIPIITLLAGDRIRYDNNQIEILSPSPSILQSSDLNDTSIVELITTEKLKILLTGDIGKSIEDFLVERIPNKLETDILKIAHHGSKYSSSEKFLKISNPKIAVIEVGASNQYGHPAQEILDRLNQIGVLGIFRTDLNGTVKIFAQDNKIKVIKQ